MGMLGTDGTQWERDITGTSLEGQPAQDTARYDPLGASRTSSIDSYGKLGQKPIWER